MIAALNRRGETDIVAVDHLGTDEKWRNLLPLKIHDYLDRTTFIDQLEAGRFDARITALFHLGACSTTTEKDAAYLMENNYRYTLRLGEWWADNRTVRFIYASSAAAYGDGSQGFEDDETSLDRLRPLNAYGYSKHLFDLAARRRGWLQDMVGLKYFNVFGPHEDHKGAMRSLVAKTWNQVRRDGVVRLFQSHRDDYADGEQVRDFIYVDDATAMTLFFLDHPEIGGLFNIGSGVARSWNDLARAMSAALKLPPRIDYIPMPAELRPKYQYYTRAEMGKLRRAGCDHEVRSLETAVSEYINNYLLTNQSED